MSSDYRCLISTKIRFEGLLDELGVTMDCFGAKTASQYHDRMPFLAAAFRPRNLRNYNQLNFRFGMEGRVCDWDVRPRGSILFLGAGRSALSRQLIHTRTLLPPRSLRVLIRFSAAALRQVSAVFSEPRRFPSE